MLHKAGMLLGGGSGSSEVWLGTSSNGFRMLSISPRGMVSTKGAAVAWIVSIGSDGLSYAFNGCTGLTGSVSFPQLASVDSYGLFGAFYGCTGLTGSVSFPKLTSIGSNGLSRAFYGCTGITAVHFPAALSGNSQCTASNMGCTNATVYFDL